MKLLIVILRDGDAGAVIDRLVEMGYRVTRIASTGGFLRRGNVTLLIGAEAGEVDGVIDLLRQTCTPAEPGQHRATVFVVDAAHFEQIG
ncbi:MAG: cyclic-di-AMP receptor [Anaerolineae bacterium]|nr:cyclic-di-AMP receptor [Anaerolineae bacterium]MDW8068596.1 cyclic-di-AMP receptor [Anaerolineae bacterium]